MLGKRSCCLVLEHECSCLLRFHLCEVDEPLSLWRPQRWEKGRGREGEKEERTERNHVGVKEKPSKTECWSIIVKEELSFEASIN